MGNGSNYVSSMWGNDYITSGQGKDWILSGNNNTSQNWPNNDQIYSGNDYIRSDNTFDESNRQERGDFVAAGIGNDEVYGSSTQDILQGGGGGDDLILGDSEYNLVRTSVSLQGSGQVGDNSPSNVYEYYWKSDAEGFKRISPYGPENAVSLTKIESFGWGWRIDENGVGIITNSNQFSKLTRVDNNGGNDRLYGGSGNDWIAGQTGDDYIDGGADNDILYGDDAVALPAGTLDGNGILHGGAGDDRLYSDDGGDELYGDEGNDSLHASINSEGDYLDGGAGDDVFFASYSNQSKFVGGSGKGYFYAENSINGQFTGDSDVDVFLLQNAKNAEFNGASGKNSYVVDRAALLKGANGTVTDAGDWNISVDYQSVIGNGLIRDTTGTILMDKAGHYQLWQIGNDIALQAIENNKLSSGVLLIKNGASHAAWKTHYQCK